MKYLMIILNFCLFASHVQSSLLDGDHHHHHHHDDDLHDHHDDHLDDLHDHIEDQLEDHFDTDSDEIPPSALFVNQLSGFLPSNEPIVAQPEPSRGKQVEFPDFGPPASANEDFGAIQNQFDFNEPELVVRDGPIVFPDFSPPEHSSVLVQEPEVPHEDLLNAIDVRQELIPEIRLIDTDVGNSREDFDPFDDSAELALLHQEALSPAPHPVEPLPPPIPEVTSNFIGRQGRQLEITGFRDDSSEEIRYPQYAFVPQTSFSCADQSYGGYFADVEANCQVFHVCLNGGLMGSFLCPNQTVFNQQLFVCDWWFNVDCSSTSQGYELNSRIGTDEHFLL